jgi:hypothetical protein
VSKLLPWFVLCLVLGPHLIPFEPPDSREPSSSTEVVEFKDDGQALPERERLASLAEKDPVAFLEACLRRYAREVKSYTVTLQKQERLKGNLEKKEIIDISFREQPFSVLFRWKQGARLATRALYIEGENRDEKTGRSQVVIKPGGLGGSLLKLGGGDGLVTRDPEGTDARKCSRYTINEFGLNIALERTLSAWKAAREKDALHVEYLGKQKPEQAGARECFVLRRSRYAKPEVDGITEQTLYIDTENWLMVGSVLRNADDRLIAEYWFRDIRLNVEFDRDLFTRKSVEN